MYCLELGPRQHKNESTVELKLLQRTETKCDGEGSLSRDLHVNSFLREMLATV